MNLKKWLCSFRTSCFLLVVYAVLLAVATFVEKYTDTATAFSFIYHAPWFVLLQAFMALSFVCSVWRFRREWKFRWAFWLTHLAFLVILIGASASFFWSEEGILHLREGEQGRTFVVRKGLESYERTLPFDIRLDDFRVIRYPGSSSPASFESDVTVLRDGTVVKAKIYMNHVLDMGGYRFFQTSYDPDERGTVLTVNRDTAGRRITYTGYFLLAVGLLGMFFDSRSRFRRIDRQLRRLRAAGCLFFVVTANVAASSSVEIPDFLKRNIVPVTHAERFGALPVQSHSGRIMPANTFAREILRKLVRSEQVDGMTPDQFLLSVYLWPQEWAKVALFEIPDEQIRSRYGLGNQSRCTFTQFFESDGTYKLQSDLDKIFVKAPGERTRYDKDLIKLDESVNIFYSLASQQLMRIFPHETKEGCPWFAPGGDLSSFAGEDSMFVSRIFVWYLSAVEEAAISAKTEEADKVLSMISTYQNAKGKEVLDAGKIGMELTYNRLQPFRTCRIGYFVCGGLLLCIAFMRFFRTRHSLKILTWGLFVSLVFVFLYHTYGMAMRWMISGYAPWSNAYETMIYVAWATALGGLFFIRHNPIVTALSALLGGVMLFVSGLNWMDPQITPLVPVLRSVWLLFHVAVIVAAYGFFGIGCLLGLVNLFLLVLARRSGKQLSILRIEELTLINERVLWVGLALMAAGTFLGAVWANESWGRYWGWDPKETWALITMIVYVLVTHLHLVSKSNRLVWFNLLAFVAFAAVLMTFFGVNYWLSGMHSYA